MTVSPNRTVMVTGGTQLFTAQVAGTDSYTPAVTWSVNGVAGGNSTYGTITSAGLYTAPATLPNPNGATITAASAQQSAIFGTGSVGLYAPASLTSMSPSSASASQQITLTGQYLMAVDSVIFTGAKGTVITVPVKLQISDTQVTAIVPFGAASGPVSVTVSPYSGITETTNSISLTRLPNLQVHASNKDLSAGENPAA